MNSNSRTDTLVILPGCFRQAGTRPKRESRRRNVRKVQSEVSPTKVAAFPRTLGSAQVESLVRLADGRSEASSRSLATIQHEVEGILEDGALTLATLQRFWEVEVDIIQFLCHFEPERPGQCQSSLPWLRRLVDDVARLHRLPARQLTAARRLCAELTNISVEISRILGPWLLEESGLEGVNANGFKA